MAAGCWSCFTDRCTTTRNSHSLQPPVKLEQQQQQQNTPTHHSIPTLEHSFIAKMDGDDSSFLLSLRLRQKRTHHPRVQQSITVNTTTVFGVVPHWTAWDLRAKEEKWDKKERQCPIKTDAYTSSTHPWKATVTTSRKSILYGTILHYEGINSMYKHRIVICDGPEVSFGDPRLLSTLCTELSFLRPWSRYRFRFVYTWVCVIDADGWMEIAV